MKKMKIFLFKEKNTFFANIILTQSNGSHLPRNIFAKAYGYTAKECARQIVFRFYEQLGDVLGAPYFQEEHTDSPIFIKNLTLQDTIEQELDKLSNKQTKELPLELRISISDK